MKTHLMTDMLRVCAQPTRRVVEVRNTNITGRKTFAGWKMDKLPDIAYEQPLSKFRDTGNSSPERVQSWQTWGDRCV